MLSDQIGGLASACINYLAFEGSNYESNTCSDVCRNISDKTIRWWRNTLINNYNINDTKYNFVHYLKYLSDKISAFLTCLNINLNQWLEFQFKQLLLDMILTYLACLLIT